MSELLQERAPDVAASAEPPAATDESQGSQTATEYAFAHLLSILSPSFAHRSPIAATFCLYSTTTDIIA